MHVKYVPFQYLYKARFYLIYFFPSTSLKFNICLLSRFEHKTNISIAINIFLLESSCI
jgi:hypothetical protein